MGSREHQQDRQIVRGLDALINKDVVAPGMSLIDIERALINETPDYKQRHEPEPMDGIIHEIGDQFGISVDDIVGELPPRQGSHMHNNGSYRATQASRTSPPQFETRARSSPNQSSYARDTRGDTSGSVYESARPTPPAVYDSTDYSDDDNDDVPEGLYSRQSLASGYTREQRHRNNFNSIIPHDQDFSNRLEIGENMEDEKAEMLADIELLLSALEADGVPIERLEQAKPTMDSPYKQVQSFFRGLQKKVDKNRGSAIIEEGVIFGVSLLEDLFDGKNEYFGYRPDLTGYSNTARTKMRRLRPESAVLASSVLQSSSMGPGTRMLLELIPSMVLHSRARRQQYGETGVFDDSSMVTANTTIRRHGDA